MCSGDFARETQPEPRAIYATITRIIHAHEPIEDFLALVRGYLAGIRDLQSRGAVLHIKFESNVTAFTVVLHGVVHEILQYLL